jgi:hypothetical protein
VQDDSSQSVTKLTPGVGREVKPRQSGARQYETQTLYLSATLNVPMVIDPTAAGGRPAT